MLRRLRRMKGDKGISTVIVAVSLTGVFGAAVLAVDAGGLWATRRRLVTGTDAAALGAARVFATGLADSCRPAGRAQAEVEATTILHANEPEAEHDEISTPNGYQVSTHSGDCSVGHVRFDSRLTSAQAFSGIFGFGKVKPFSSSTAEFGYVTAIAGQLRPWTVCDQHDSWNLASPAPTPLPAATGAGPFPHFALWNWLKKGEITQAQYDSYFGQNNADDGYPTHATKGINAGQNYLSPLNGGGVVHKVNLTDNCGGGSSWNGWVKYEDGSNGSTLGDWITDGYPGSVSLVQPAPGCGAGMPNGSCADFPGNKNGIAQPALDDITCPAATPSKDCFVFPVILNQGVTGNGGSAEVNQKAFLFVILRGRASDTQQNACKGSDGCILDMEFVDIQATGLIGPNPSGNATTPKGIALCGIDHDSVADRCDI